MIIGEEFLNTVLMSRPCWEIFFFALSYIFLKKEKKIDFLSFKLVNVGGNKGLDRIILKCGG